MNVRIHRSWKNILSGEFNKQYFRDLVKFVKYEYSHFEVYPRPKDIFNAFDLCSFDSVKVVIIGQDPYPAQGQAHGLCFSVNDGIAIPKSLNNIFKELENDVGHVNKNNGNLSRWARQGVFLLNTTLTVRAGKPGSHVGHGWEIFTDEVIRQISAHKHNVVFILWGNNAKRKASLVNQEDNLVLTSAHPSPLSAKGFFGNHHFSRTNNYLLQHGIEVINWE